jgi:formate dehydrogenase subunit gamma
VITLRMDALEGAREPSTHPDMVLRFRASERHLHWAIAIPFKVCYLTALILVTVYNPDPSRPFRFLVSWVHRGSGVCLAVLPLLTILWHRREFWMHLQNVRRAWTWTLGDLKWLLLMGPAAVSPRVTLPHQGKFNAAEKINFMVLSMTYPVYVATGLTIWFLGPAFISWIVHFSMAVAATPLVFGHIFMATVNPDTRVGLPGMFSGFVDRHWARHHYRLWYDECHAVPAPVEVPVAAAAAVSVAPAVTVAAPVAPAVQPVRTPAAGVPPAAPRPRPVRTGASANPSFAS